MTETAIIALITAIIAVFGTLAGGLGATALANSNARKQNLANRAFAIQDSARQMLVTILVEAREWLKVSTTVAMVVAATDRLSDADDYLANTLVDSSSGQQLRQRSEHLSRAITEAKLLISDRGLNDAITHVEAMHSKWWEETLDPIRELFKEGTADKVERLRPVWRFEARFNAALAAVETHATEAIASSLKGA